MSVLLSWSGGKDSAWTFYVLQQRGIRVKALLVVLDPKEGIPLHGIDRDLVRMQAKALNVSLIEVNIPFNSPLSLYRERIIAALTKAKRSKGIKVVAFGDILGNRRKTIRSEIVTDAGLTSLFPLQGFSSIQLAKQMINGGLRARVTCIDSRILPDDLLGSHYDLEFLANLDRVSKESGNKVDYIAENGEFHTFAFGGPPFNEEMDVTLTDTPISMYNFKILKLVGRENAVCREN